MINVDGKTAALPTVSPGSAQATTPTLRDVGRDPWFLNAVQDGAAEPADGNRGVRQHADDTALRARSQGNPRPTETGHGLGAETSVMGRAAASPVSHAGSSSPAAGTTASGFLPGHAGATILPAPTRDIASATSRLASAAYAAAVADDGRNRPAPRHLHLRETANGLDVTVRDYFLDDSGRDALLQHLLTLLRIEGHRPREIRINGELAWRSPDATTTAGGRISPPAAPDTFPTRHVPDRRS